VVYSLQFEDEEDFLLQHYSTLLLVARIDGAIRPDGPGADDATGVPKRPSFQGQLACQGRSGA